MTEGVRSLRVRIGTDLLDVPLKSVARVGLLDRVSWSGTDAAGGPLLLAQTDDGPVVVLAASAFLNSASASPEPAWAIVLTGHEEAVLAFAACEVLGFVQSHTPAVVSRPTAPTPYPIPS